MSAGPMSESITNVSFRIEPIMSSLDMRSVLLLTTMQRSYIRSRTNTLRFCAASLEGGKVLKYTCRCRRKSFATGRAVAKELKASSRDELSPRIAATESRLDLCLSPVRLFCARWPLIRRPLTIGSIFAPETWQFKIALLCHSAKRAVNLLLTSSLTPDHARWPFTLHPLTTGSTFDRKAG